MSYSAQQKNPGIIVFDHCSDIPGAEVDGLTWEELKVVAELRFMKAGRPMDKLTAWLDDHIVGSRSADPELRIRKLDWWGMRSLMGEARVWMDERYPPKEDTE